MMPISGMNTGALQPSMTAGKILGAPKVQKHGEEAQGRPLKPVMDAYVPEGKQEPSGRYWLGKDEGGRPKVFFDDPERAADAPEGTEGAPDAGRPGAPDAEEPEKDKGAEGPRKKEGEVCVGNTDKVDREIERLKKEKEELERQIETEHDETKRKELERQLAQVERELTQKDNDTYRKQHSTFTQLS